jgi:uncharacterized protein YbjT (DUF2867 family)
MGVDVVITSATAILSGSVKAVDQDGYLALVSAARQNAVRRFIYTSLPMSLSSSPLVDAKRTVEASLRGSGLTYTILQPTCFMQSWAGKETGWDITRRKGAIYGDGSAPVGWVDIEDVAGYALESLTNDAAQNADVAICGDIMNYADVRRTFEAVTGQPFKIMRIPNPLLALGPHLRRLSPKFCSALTLGGDVAHGRTVVNASKTLQDFAIRPATLEQYVKRLARL